jgi:hypothetical protein
MSASSYANSQGLRLLSAAVQELGPLFTREVLQPLAARQGLSREHLSKLLSLLNASGQIAILKRGVYAVQSPLYAGEIHPFAIAAALLQPVAISHWSALAHHGFTTQLPQMVQATTTAAVITPEMRRGHALRPRQRAVWRALNVEEVLAPLRAYPVTAWHPLHSWREHPEKPSTNGVNECAHARSYSFIRSLFVDGLPQ